MELTILENKENKQEPIKTLNPTTNNDILADCKYLHTNDSKGKHRRFYLNGSIYNDVDWFHPLLQLLNTATENDTIDLYMNTPGGGVTSVTQILNTIRNSKAVINLHVQGECSSGGTVLCFGAMDKYNSVSIDPYCLFLFHTASSFS